MYQILETSFDGDKAEKSRKAVVLAPSRVDYVDRKFFTMKPFARVGNMHYRTTQQHQDPKLQFNGISYGTMVGLTFASLYPQHVSRILLDGTANGKRLGW